jgi:hypothetical protein
MLDSDRTLIDTMRSESDIWESAGIKSTTAGKHGAALASFECAKLLTAAADRLETLASVKN